VSEVAAPGKSLADCLLHSLSSIRKKPENDDDEDEKGRVYLTTDD
jgi:hypothetical protein